MSAAKFAIWPRDGMASEVVKESESGGSPKSTTYGTWAPWWTAPLASAPAGGGHPGVGRFCPALSSGTARGPRRDGRRYGYRAADFALPSARRFFS